MKINTLAALAFCLLGLFSTQAQTTDSDADFYDMNTIQEINIQFPTDNWAELLDSLRYNGDGLLLGNVEINGRSFENAGVRYRASRSFSPGNKRNSLFIKLNYINKSQTIDGHPTLQLSSALRDPSMVREVLSYKIARDYMPAPKANYARVKINGALYGLFVNVEDVSEKFLTDHFGSSENAFFKVNPFAGDDTPPGCLNKIYGALIYEPHANCYLNNFIKLSEHGWDDLMELTRVLNEKPESVSKVLHVDRALWMLAFNNVLVNLSSYTGQHSINYFLYQDDAGQFTPIIWDLNLSFGSFKNTGIGSDLKLKGLQELDPLLHLNNDQKPLISRLLENDTYQKIYLSHMRTIVNDYFINGEYEKIARELQDLIRDDFGKDPGQSYTASDFAVSLTKTIGKRSKIPGIVELMEKRANFLHKHPKLAVFPPEISKVEVLKRAKFSNVPVTDFCVTAKIDRFPKRVRLMYRLGSDGPFKEATMYDDGQHKDGEANDGIFGVTIVPQNGETSIQYYIVAENATLISYHPSNYMWDVHSTNLQELNK